MVEGGVGLPHAYVSVRIVTHRNAYAYMSQEQISDLALEFKA